jgi:tRNA modification GTPase
VTGEDVLELHIHGGPAVVKAVLNAIPRCEGAGISGQVHASIRYAEPGEFTRRAFLNDRLDLPQIEALGNTLAAETEQQRHLAVRGTNQALSTRYETWRQELLYARGELEALIDFSEDQHFDESVEELVSSVAVQVRSLLRQIKLHVENAAKGELMRNGIKVALLGAPNAGKSSLLNRVVGREAAIVSSEEGTTRDIVDVGVDLGGWLCKFGDMAGLRSAGTGSGRDKAGGSGSPSAIIGEIEKEGIRRAKARALESDVVIVVMSVEKPESETATARLVMEPEVLEATQSCLKMGKRVLVAVNKTDYLSSALGLSHYAREICSAIPQLTESQIFPISCKEAEENAASENPDPGNIQSLLAGLIRTFEEMSKPATGTGDDTQEGGGELNKSYWEDSLGVTHRQSSNLQKCARHLGAFLSQIQTPADALAKPQDKETQTHTDTNTAKQQRQQSLIRETDVDIVTAAESLRFAADYLAKITGRGEGGDVESVLGVVFEK